MPVARRVDAPETWRERIDRRENPVAACNRERTARQEVVLNVDDDQRVVRPDGDAHETTMFSSLSGTKMRLRTVLPSVWVCTPLSAIASA